MSRLRQPSPAHALESLDLALEFCREGLPVLGLCASSQLNTESVSALPDPNVSRHRIGRRAHGPSREDRVRFGRYGSRNRFAPDLMNRSIGRAAAEVEPRVAGTVVWGSEGVRDSPL